MDWCVWRRCKIQIYFRRKAQPWKVLGSLGSAAGIRLNLALPSSHASDLADFRIIRKMANSIVLRITAT